MKYTINDHYRCVVKTNGNVITISVQSRYWFIFWQRIEYQYIEIDDVKPGDEEATKRYPFYPNVYPMVLSTISNMHGYYDHEIWPLGTFSLHNRLEEIRHTLMRKDEAMRVCTTEALNQVMTKTKLTE